MQNPLDRILKGPQSTERFKVDGTVNDHCAIDGELLSMKESLDSIRLWASEIRQGNFAARLPQTSKPEAEGLTDDINRLAEWLESLAEDQEAQVLVQQSQLEQESGRVLRFEERTRLANELHDSLAQTLAGLKMQVRVLDDTLRQDNEAAMWQEMERIQAALDDANIELRDLITHFRSPIGRQGIIPAIEKLVSRFRLQMSTDVVLQNEWPESAFDGELESQVLRIVQESLHNARKHSQANFVRVLLTHGEVHRYRVVVEDDGVGFSTDNLPVDGSGHFGLAIMRERAEAIDADLRIESENSEGTQVILEFNGLGCY